MPDSTAIVGLGTLDLMPKMGLIKKGAFCGNILMQSTKQGYLN